MTDTRDLCQFLVRPRADAPLDDLARLALAHDVAACFLWAARTLPLPDSDAIQAARAAAQRTAVHTMLMERTTTQVADALAAAAIPHLWLKGAALAATVYPDTALRPLVDLDVLVPFEQRWRALAALRERGFTASEMLSLHDANADAAADHLHHFTLQGHSRTLVELHFRLLGADGKTLLPPEQAAWFSRQTMPYAHLGRTFTTLTPEAHLLYLCAHAVLQHGTAYFALKWYLDLHLLVSRYALDWEAALAQAAALRWTYAVERALDITAGLFDTHLPAHVLPALRASRPADEDTRRVDALAGSGARFELVRASLAQMPPRERLARSVRIVLPPPAYMRQRYPASRSLWAAYTTRWYNQLYYLAQAAWARIRRRRSP